MEYSLKSFVDKIENIPTLPEIAQEILKLNSDALLSIDKIKNIIEKDPAISAKILSVANSALFGFLDPITNLDDAIMRIGFNNVKSIAVGISLMSFFDDSKMLSDYNRIFNHSIAVSLTARYIGHFLKTGVQEDILMEGLLHDLGYLILIKYSPDKYQDILNLLNDEMSLLDAEKNLLNCYHADVGYWLALRWNLPDPILDAILYHHSPSLGGNAIHNSIVHIADYIVTTNVCSPVEKNPNFPLDRRSFDILSISERDLKDMEESTHHITLSDEFSNMLQVT